MRTSLFPRFAVTLMGFALVWAGLPFLGHATRFTQPMPLPSLSPVQNNAFRPGERLMFKAHYGALTAGIAVLEVDDQLHTVNGQQTYRIEAQGRTLSAFEWFYKVRDEFYTHVTTTDLRPLKYHRVTNEGDYHFVDDVSFNYEANTITGRKGTFQMQPGTQDMISALYYARNLDLRTARVGTIFNIPTFIDDQIFPLGMKVKGRDVVNTPFGKFRCIMLTPIVVDGRVFKGREEMTIWVTDDANLIPVQVASPLMVGSAKASLINATGLRHPLTSRID